MLPARGVCVVCVCAYAYIAQYMPSYLCVGVHVCKHVCYDTLSCVSLYGPTSFCFKVVSGTSVHIQVFSH